MIDLALLRILKYKDRFDKVAKYVKLETVDKRTKAVILDFKKYFKDNPDETQIDMPAFRSLFFNAYHKGMKEEQIDFYNKLLANIETDVSASIDKNIVNQLVELNYATKLGNLIMQYESGEEIDLVPIVDKLTKAVQESLVRASGFEYLVFEEDKLETVDPDSGLLWPIDCMNEVYRNIFGGDQYIVAARPGKGKTTFLTHNNCSMATQMSENKIIVWFNNESRKERILHRQIQSALGATNSELYKHKQAGTLKEEYIKAMGSADRVRIYDIHGKNSSFIEDVLESIGLENVGAIIFDMLDNVQFPVRDGMREDQRLEQMYQWSRELGVKYNCPIFPTSQVSNEGAGELFPTANMLKDSKTGKQGACDGIIMIGDNEDPTTPNNRGISMPKTKSKREGKQDLRAVVNFDADRGRYK